MSREKLILKDTPAKKAWLDYKEKYATSCTKMGEISQEQQELDRYIKAETITLIQENGLLSEKPLSLCKVKDDEVILESSSDRLVGLSDLIETTYHCYSEYEYQGVEISIHFSDGDIYVHIPLDKYSFIIKEFGIAVSMNNLNAQIILLKESIAGTQASLKLLEDMKALV